MEKLKELAQEFIDDRDRSLRLVREIESILIVEFLETDLYEALAEAVSLYCPGGNLPYFSESDMKNALQEALGLSPST